MPVSRLRLNASSEYIAHITATRMGYAPRFTSGIISTASAAASAWRRYSVFKRLSAMGTDLTDLVMFTPSSARERP